MNNSKVVGPTSHSEGVIAYINQDIVLQTKIILLQTNYNRLPPKKVGVGQILCWFSFRNFKKELIISNTSEISTS